jgi:hypothetical protein
MRLPPWLEAQHCPRAYWYLDAIVALMPKKLDAPGRQLQRAIRPREELDEREHTDQMRAVHLTAQPAQRLGAVPAAVRHDDRRHMVALANVRHQIGQLLVHRALGVLPLALDCQPLREGVGTVNYPGASAGASPVIEQCPCVTGLSSSRGAFWLSDVPSASKRRSP